MSPRPDTQGRGGRDGSKSGRGHANRRNHNGGRGRGGGRAGGGGGGGRGGVSAGRQNTTNRDHQQHRQQHHGHSHHNNHQHNQKQRPQHSKQSAEQQQTVKDSMNELSNQMQLISDTLGNAISSSISTDSSGGNAKQQQKHCRKCHNTASTLAKLQEHVNKATKQVQKMSLTLTVLQTHANLVQQTLETIQSHVTEAFPAPAESLSPFASVEGENNGKPLVDLEVQCQGVKDDDDSKASSLNSGRGLVHNEKRQKQQISGRVPTVTGPLNDTSQGQQKQNNQQSSSKPNKDLMLQRKQQNAKPQKAAAATMAAVPSKIKSLEDLLEACAPYLTGGSYMEYTVWLRQTLDIFTIEDLAEAVTDEDMLEELVAGVNGYVEIVQKHKFCKTVLAAAASLRDGKVKSGRSDDTPPTEDKASGFVMSREEGGGMEGTDEVDWACPICTCINPKLFLVCSACGHTNSGAEADTTEDRKPPPQLDGSATVALVPSSRVLLTSEVEKKHGGAASSSKSAYTIGGDTSASSAKSAASSGAAFDVGSASLEPVQSPDVGRVEANNKLKDMKDKQAELKQAQAKKRQEDNAKKQREKAKQNKAKELARRQEEERAEAEAEQRRRMEAKLQKQAALARHEAEVQRKRFVQQVVAPTIKKTNKVPTTKKSSMVTDTSARQEAKAMSSRQGPKKNNTKSQPISRKKKKMTAEKLSFYIKPSRKRGGEEVSPIFDLIQNESTVETGRRLMTLEVETQRAREELAELVGKRSRLENGIKAEEGLIGKSQSQIEALERKVKTKWNLFGISLFDDDEKEVEKKLGQIEEEEDDEVEPDIEPSDEEEIAAGNTDDVKEVKEEDGKMEQADNEEGVEGVKLQQKKKPPTLKELCSGYLTGPLEEYISFLHSKNIKTITDLGATIMKNTIGMKSAVDQAALFKGSGNVGIMPGREQQFTSAVLAAVSGMENESKSKKNDKSKKNSETSKEDEETQLRKKRARDKARKKEKKKSNRYHEVKQARERIESLKKLIETSRESSVNQKAALAGVAPLLARKMKELQQLREDVTQIKGDGIEEDINFHIDKTRDDRGFSFLMVAAQNNDFFTAKLCFEFGADAHAKSHEGFTAIDYSYFFGYEHVTNLIIQNGGTLPQKQSEVWKSLSSMTPVGAESKSWDDTLKVAETAALPAETLMEDPSMCENDEDKRMPVLSAQERAGVDFTCFESRLINQNINSHQVHRVVLIDKNVYNWCLSVDETTRASFVNLLEGLLPSSVRRAGVQATKIHRRSLIGATTTYEVLGAKLTSDNETTALFTPFVSGEVEGKMDIGVLVWAVVPDSEASLYKTLIANTEFMRHKVQLDDRFLAHKEAVLDLGKDMHLLDLHSTSIWTTATMDLFILNIDEGDLDKIHDPAFSAKQRVVYSEEQVNKAIFRTSQAEAEEEEGILASERLDMSTLIMGGAGTGKTLLMIKKVSQEDPSRKVLVVSRLPRLVGIIKTAVEERREDGATNQTFTTYDDLMQLLARRVVPDDDYNYKSFVSFDRIRYDSGDSNISFAREFVAGYLNTKERKDMAKMMIEPLTLFSAIITIKSQAKCALTKLPLTSDDFVALPPSFGLTKEQRQLCYSLFLKYEHWREGKGYWDEMERALYILKWGPNVYREDKFIPWVDRVNRFGQMDLLDDEGEPLYPFFYDIVCADESQDFTDTDLILFAKMSSSMRSLFLSADPAQSVEVGVTMRESTVNDVLHSLIKDTKHSVQDVLQYITLQTNHRTHQQNLAIGLAIRRILARSFRVPITYERALINGKLPKMLSIRNICDLADTNVFRGGNIVFITPDTMAHELRLQFNDLGIKNDLFGVREAKGLEFDTVALIGFFSFIEGRGSEEWINALRWLSSSSTLTKTASTGERVAGVMLADCDYRLSAPHVSDDAMMLYTAVTRARNHLYLIETQGQNIGKGKKQKGPRLADFAFRRFADLGLAKQVVAIDEGNVEMTAAQHKARGVLMVTQALNMSRNREPIADVKKKFTDALDRFRPNKGDDKDLFDKCQKHLNAMLQKHSLLAFAKEHFLSGGDYDTEGRFTEVLEFERKAGRFFSQFLCDSFLVEEVHDVRTLVEEIFAGTPYEDHFSGVCNTIAKLEQAV